MYIIGLNAYHADSSAAIFKDGGLVIGTEEERFRRIKHWAGSQRGCDGLFEGSRDYPQGGAIRKHYVLPD